MEAPHCRHKQSIYSRLLIGQLHEQVGPIIGVPTHLENSSKFKLDLEFLV